MAEIVLPHGNYQELESYQNSVIIFNATQDFCANFLKKGDRTIDQMIQAARSGKQNIIEGCMASGISSETEIKLIGVARASLEELVEDYRDFLRTHKLPLWKKEDPRILQIRQLAKQKNKTYETYKSYLSADNPELFCNTMISLIHQTNYLLDRQIKSLEKSFTEKGGIRERMSNARKSYRSQQTEEVLALLREIYRDLAKQDNQELMQKIEKAANILKKEDKNNMTFYEIEQKVKNALQLFYKEDRYLIDNNVHERSVTFRLGMYLQNEFPNWKVDCEYNKNYQTFQHNKLLSERCNKKPNFNCKYCGDRRKCTVFPDIIIHQRETDKNLLVIEAKCNASVSQIAEDKKKLQAYLNEPTLHYQHSLFINFQETLEKTLKDLYWVPDNYDCEGRKNIGNEVE